MSLQQHFETLSVMQLKQIIREHNLHTRIMLTQKKEGLIKGLLDHFSGMLPNGDLQSKIYTIKTNQQNQPQNEPQNEPQITKTKITEQQIDPAVAVLNQMMKPKTKHSFLVNNDTKAPNITYIPAAMKEKEKEKARADELMLTESKVREILPDPLTLDQEARRTAEDEARARSSVVQQLRNLNGDLDSFKAQLDEEQSQKSEIQKLLAKANSEAQLWKSKYESEGLGRTEELEEAKKKLLTKLVEAEEQVEQALIKCSSLECRV